MKYHLLSFLMAISITSMANASGYPVIIPSGQQLYFNFYQSSEYSPAAGYAILSPPAYGWTGYSKPGGNVLIPDTITYNGLEYVVTQIADGAFRYCNAITSVVIPNTVTRIQNDAFNNCTSLQTLTIGEGVSVIGSSIINYCPNLDTIYYYPESCNSGNLFYSGEIGQHTIVIIGDNVNSIPVGMFQKNEMTRSIESVVVGGSVTTIGNNAFTYCTNLTSITFRSQNPPMLGSNVFSYVNTSNIQCNIPCGRTSVYFNQWGTLFNYTEASAGYSLQVSSNYDSWGTAEIIQQPSCTGNAVIGATASCGYYFVRWSDGNTDNPRTLTLQYDTYLTAIFASSYNVPDTMYVHDTTTINNYIHDTTYLPIYLHDTVPMVEYLHDTIYLPQYIHDTTIINNHFRDTIYLPQYIHDTVSVNNYIHDTIYLPQYIHDTTYVNVCIHDTTVVTDTLTMYDTIINTVFDTIDNFIYDTLLLTDTVWLHDTIVIHDTVYITQEGINGVDALNAKVYSSQGQIVVEGAEGNMVTLYDVNGRVLATKQDDFTPLRFDAPVSGTYMIKIGAYPARKMVVIR